MLRYLIMLATLSALPMSIGCQKSEFADFSPAGGGFKVAMPGTPQEQSQTTNGIAMKTYMVGMTNGDYFVSYSDSRLPPTASDKQVQHRLDLARDGQLNASGGKLLSESNIQIDGKYPGREVNSEIPAKKAFARWRIYFVDGKLFQVFALGRESWVKSPDVDTFFNSFALTK